MFIFPAIIRPLLAVWLLIFVACGAAHSQAAGLPFDTVFKGRKQFDTLVAQADKWKGLPIGQRVAEVGRAMTGTRYRSFTLEIDDHIEAPSVNLTGLDCWTFFESSLAFARMLDEPKDNWTPQTMLKYIELDRYRSGSCTGSYLSRLHYLEDWLHDNDRRGLVRDLTRDLGGVPAAHNAVEMTRGWKSYRYMRQNPDLRAGIARMEARVASEPLYYIPKSQVPGIESRLQSGDIIGICSHDGRLIGTAHVGLAYRTSDGTLHFMHASAPHNYGKVVLDQRLSDYLFHFRSDAGIIVGRPLK
ncbi:MAG: N-acetylmuramoyl-L-alanine amidase-like domain-containing protein [Chthoniobacter sp.]|uniref:N-acetylmuramoyl-L-alanine amidase-like domain-containing protein n=1 Tax=Chthoniobacter sp. TaxID=2510640 RepID=UPI0032A68941